MEEEFNENLYSEKLKKLDYRELVLEKALYDKQKNNMYIKGKEIDNEFKRRLEM